MSTVHNIVIDPKAVLAYARSTGQKGLLKILMPLASDETLEDIWARPKSVADWSVGDLEYKPDGEFS